MGEDKMDNETLNKMGAVVKEIAVSYERKVSDGNFGSVGGQFFVTADVVQGADPETAINALYEWVKAKATANLKASFGAVAQRAPQPELPEPEQRIPICPVHNEEMAVSKFGGYYCQKKDGDEFCKEKVK
jgi:hypothetical protein